MYGCIAFGKLLLLLLPSFVLLL